MVMATYAFLSGRQSVDEDLYAQTFLRQSPPGAVHQLTSPKHTRPLEHPTPTPRGCQSNATLH